MTSVQVRRSTFLIMAQLEMLSIMERLTQLNTT